MLIKCDDMGDVTTKIFYNEGLCMQSTSYTIVDWTFQLGERC